MFHAPLSDGSSGRRWKKRVFAYKPYWLASADPLACLRDEWPCIYLHTAKIALRVQGKPVARFPSYARLRSGNPIDGRPSGNGIPSGGKVLPTRKFSFG
jgi:hypothetical protein